MSWHAFTNCLLNRSPLRVVMEACVSAHHWAPLIHGARAVLNAAMMKRKREQKLDRFHAWAPEVAARRGHNKAAVALTNKLARRLWAMTRDGKPFDDYHVSAMPALCPSPTSWAT